MKGLIIAVVVTGVIGGIVLLKPTTTEYVRESSEEEITAVEEVVEIDMIEKRIEEAQVEAMKEIDAKADTLRGEFVANELKKIESAVLKEIQAELKERQISADKQTGAYWSDPQNIKAHIRAMFPEDPHTALAIVACESGFKPNAYNPTNTNGTTDGGLWQINTVHDETLRQLGLDKWNPEDATQYARMLYERNGWRDWVCYTHGMIAMR